MWPLSLFLLFAISGAPQQNAPDPGGAYLGKLPQTLTLRSGDQPSRKLSAEDLGKSNDCYFIRSYHFRRQDGQAPVLTGMTTCTPGNVLRQRQVSEPKGLLVPLGLRLDNEGNSQK